MHVLWWIFLVFTLDAMSYPQLAYYFTSYR